MNSDKAFKFEQRWIEIERERKDLEFRRAQLCRDIRGEFPGGESGDEEFCKWCATKLGVTAFGARELLTQARAVAILPDEAAWKEIGGLRAIRPVVDLSRRDQTSVLQAAKAQHRAPINVMRERGLLIKPEAPVTPLAAPKPQPSPFPVKPRPDPYLDAVVLAQFIAKTNKNIPRDIRAVVERYQAFMRKVS